MSSPSGLWRDRKLPGSSRRLKQACLRGRMPFSKHHDQSPSVQQRFVAHTKARVIAFQEAGNPFDEDSHEVVIIDTREVMPDNVARSIMGAHGEGKKQHDDFVVHRLQCTAVAFHAPIKMKKIHLPGNRHKNRNKSKYVHNTKEDMHLLGQLYNENEHQGRE